MTTVLACVFIFIQMIFDGINSRAIVHHNPKSFNDFFLSFGIILFSFGGASTFPTIQNDMIDRGKFKRSVYIGFAGKNVLTNHSVLMGKSLIQTKLTTINQRYTIINNCTLKL